MPDYKEKIKEFFRRERISHAKRIVAEFVISCPEDTAFLTLQELSKKIRVSPSTISRTATEMGFNGFPGLQQEIRPVLKSSTSPLDRLKNTPSETTSLIWEKSIARDAASMQSLLSLNSIQKFEEAIELFSKAPRVFSLSLRSSYPLTFFFNFLLFQIRPEVHHVSFDDGSLTESVFTMEPGDVFFVISFPRYTKIVLEIAEKARKADCHVISITDSELSPLAIASQISFFCPYESVSFFNSNVPAQALINSLLAGIRLRLGKKGIERLKQHSDMMKDWSNLSLRPTHLSSSS